MSSIENDIEIINSYLSNSLSAEASAQVDLRLQTDLEFNGLFQDISASNEVLTLDELYKIKQTLDNFDYKVSPWRQFISLPINWIGSISAIMGISTLATFGFITAFQMINYSKSDVAFQEISTIGADLSVSAIKKDVVIEDNLEPLIKVENGMQTKTTNVLNNKDFALVTYVKARPVEVVQSHELKSILPLFDKKVAIPCSKPEWRVTAESASVGESNGSISFKLKGKQKEYYSVILDNQYLETYDNEVRFNNLSAGKHNILLSLENGCGYEINEVIINDENKKVETGQTNMPTSYIINAKKETFKLPAKFDSQYITIKDKNHNIVFEKEVKKNVPFEWNLVAKSGEKVASGTYYYFVDYAHASDEEDIHGELEIK